MTRLRIFPVLIAAVALFAAPTAADAGDFWDFLRDAWENYQNSQNGYQDDEESAEALEDQIAASAQQAGAAVNDPDQYSEYAQKLALTLSRLTPEQQARVFNPS